VRKELEKGGMCAAATREEMCITLEFLCRIYASEMSWFIPLHHSGSILFHASHVLI
jgi:hypothetical protein